MARASYQTDLTDKQWQTLEPLLPPARPGGRPRSVDLREVINGILYVLRSGGGWRHLPHDLPNWRTCWFYFDRFSQDGTWQQVGGTLSEADSKLSAGISDEMSIIKVRLDGIGGSGPFQQDTGPDGIVSVEAEKFDNNTARNGDSWSKQVGSGSDNAFMEVGPDDSRCSILAH